MIIEINSLYKDYTQDSMIVPVLKNINMQVSYGEYIAIMGPSGSGKTTLMNILGCLDVPTSGEYLLEGEEVSKKNDEEMAQIRNRSIGFVFQTFNLMPRQSAWENVALPLIYQGVNRRDRRDIAADALKKVGLEDRINFRPTQLSGGQCQRVAIARAICTQPKLLLADEPTGALDTASGSQVMDIFDTLHSEGVTVVLITHEPEVAARAQKTMHIRDGILDTGVHA